MICDHWLCATLLNTFSSVSDCGSSLTCSHQPKPAGWADTPTPCPRRCAAGWCFTRVLMRLLSTSTTSMGLKLELLHRRVCLWPRTCWMVSNVQHTVSGHWCASLSAQANTVCLHACSGSCCCVYAKSMVLPSSITLTGRPWYTEHLRLPTQQLWTSLLTGGFASACSGRSHHQLLPSGCACLHQ